MKLTIVKQLNNTFKVAYESDYENLKKIKVGVLMQVDIKKPRNYMFHKKYFALINMLYNNQERYNNINDLREDLTIEAGFYTNRENIHGEVIKKANSISFASMDEFQFNDLYSKTLDVIVKYFNFDKQEMIDNLVDFM